MRCKDVQELMGAYLYGDLSAEEMRHIRLHVQDCAACQRDLESRSQLLAAVPNEAPSLTDDERMQLAWAVKGAIRNADLARESSRWGYVFAAGLVLAMGAAVAGIVAYNSSKPQLPANSASTKPAAVVVKIREHSSRTQSQPVGSGSDTQAQLPTAGTTTREQPRLSPEEAAPDLARRLVNLATTARRTKPQRKAAVEPPAAVVGEAQTDETSSSNNEPTLPEPVAPNDARTVSE